MGETSGKTLFRLAKVVGVLAIAASAICEEYGTGINYVAVNSLKVYPRVEYLVPLAMFATGIFLIPKVYLFARYGRHMPCAGSSYVWIARGTNLPTGFIVSFLWWIGITAGMGVLGYTFGTFLGQGLLGAGLAGGKWFFTSFGHIVIGLAVIWAIYFLHWSGVANYGSFVSILMFVVIATAAVIVAYGFSTSATHFVAAASAVAHSSLTAPANAPGPSLGAFLAVCTLFVFAYGGLTAAPTLGGEAREASTTLPRGIIWGWAVALILYTLVAWALFHAAPWWSVVGLIQSGHSGVATAPGLVSLVAPAALGVILNLVVAVIVGKTIAPVMLGSSRMLFAWAEDHILPERFAHTSTRKVPVAALTLTAVLGSLFMLQAALVGWSIGVVVRAFSILVVLGALGISTLNLKYNRRFDGLDWAAPLRSGAGMAVASILGIVIALALISSVVVLPKTPLVFQPLFQTAVAVLIALWVYGAGKSRATVRGVDLTAVVAAPPVE